MDRDGLIAALRRQGIHDERVLAAMARVPRDRFVPEVLRTKAWEDRPLSIGEGQTISQPFVVAFMVQAVEPFVGARVLDVGSGSGYQSAVLAECGCEVHALEVRQGLADTAGATLTSLGYEVDLRVGDGRAGLPELAPFDAIIVAAAAESVPTTLTGQLRVPGGRMIAPIGSPDHCRLVVFEATTSGIRREESIAVRFVPLV